MMNRASLRAVWLLSLAALSLAPVKACAATQLLYSNVTTVLNQNIDATSIRNEGLFTISSGGSIPFRPSNTLNFTNTASGTFTFDIGLRFETVTNNQQLIASNFVNEGTINVGTSGFFSLLSSGGSLIARADNIVHPGTATAGAGGLLRFQGHTVNMSRATLVASGLSDPGSAGVSNYFNPTGVKDLYWGAGTSQVFQVGATPRPLSLINAEFDFRPPFAFSPSHQVAGPSFGTNGNSFVPYFGSFGSATAYCWTNRVSASNLVFQVVLVYTNFSETNITSAVRFDRAGGRATAIVELAQPVTDPLTGQTATNQLYFLDDSIRQTNATLAANLVDPTFRPRAYELTRATPFQWYFGEPPNELIGNISYLPFGASNLVVSNYYAAYAAEIGNVANSPFAGTSSGNQSSTDPALYPGRIELIGDLLDLTLTRAQAENTIIVQTTNLVSQAGAVFDAPVIIYSAASASTIALTNFIPASVRRFNGQLFAYSAVWTNTVGGTALEYQVLILDASQLRGNQSVSLPSLNIRGTNVIVENFLNAGQSFVIDSPSLTFNATNQLFLTSTNVPSLLASNFPTLNFFTNFGGITVASEGRFGSDRVLPLAVMVNGGSISGRTHGIRADSFENTGSITASAGPLTVNTTSAKLEAVTNTGFLSASGNLTLNSGNLKIRNHTLVAGAALNLTVTNLLTDNGPGASNLFSTSLGFNLLARPAVGDLLGTTFASTALPNRVVSHAWAAEDRGARRSGFLNNAAIGRLTLAVSNNAVLNFTPVGTTNRHALYVDFLELTGPLLTNLASFVTIHSNFTLYFASANRAVETLDGQLGGRLRWVRNFSGPASTVDVLQRDGQIFQVNPSLRNSLTIDTDNDGIVNGLDEFPFDGVIVRSSITFTNFAYVSWEATAQTGYAVQVAANTNLPPVVYAPLTTFTNNAPTNVTATVSEIAPANTAGRDYRVLNGASVIPRTVTFTNRAYISWAAAGQTDYVVEVATNLPPVWQPLLTYTNNVLTNATAIVSDPVPADGVGRFYRVLYSP